MQSFEECLLMYRHTLRQLLANCGVASNPGVDDQWILDKITEVIKKPMSPEGQIWQAFGPNPSDDSRVSDPNLGYYKGERETVIDWIDLNHPGFRDHLEGRKHPRAKLYNHPPLPVTKEQVKELRNAQAEMARISERLKKAEGKK